MQKLLLKFFIAALFCLSLPCLATPQSRDANDLWIIPEESGWGANIFHQGNTMFVSLFVYGNDGRARWYTASGLVGNEPPSGDLTVNPPVSGSTAAIWVGFHCSLALFPSESRRF
jgi:hypothetical protein